MNSERELRGESVYRLPLTFSGRTGPSQGRLLRFTHPHRGWRYRRAPHAGAVGGRGAARDAGGIRAGADRRQRGVEARLLPQRNFRYHLLPAEPIYRRQWWKNARWSFAGISLLRKLSKLFREEHPVAVLGTGGYASAPVVWWASRLGIPTRDPGTECLSGPLEPVAGQAGAGDLSRAAGGDGALRQGHHGADDRDRATRSRRRRRPESSMRDCASASRRAGRTVLITGGSQGRLRSTRRWRDWIGCG